MRWRDIRFEKPTEADADRRGSVLQLLDNGRICSWNWSSMEGTVAWMPINELPAFDRIPDPPEGWRFVDKEKDKKRLPYKYVSKRSNEWRDGDSPGIPWERDTVYAVPIDPPAPPEPQYRPYNESELMQTIGELVDCKGGARCMITGVCGTNVYYQGHEVSAAELLANHTWTDGNKCGIRLGKNR
jgi:hypothetical protein